MSLIEEIWNSEQKVARQILYFFLLVTMNIRSEILDEISHLFSIRFLSSFRKNFHHKFWSVVDKVVDV